MSRTTLDIDRTILEEIRRLQRKERRSMGRITTELLAEALTSPEEFAGPRRTWLDLAPDAGAR